MSGRHETPSRVEDPAFHLDPDPLRQFGRWLADAVGAGFREPSAMTLATASADGTPSARMVLLRGYDERGLRFFTNHGSRKGRELAERPQAALVFYWDLLERQVRISGRVERLDPEESAAYFSTRPIGSRLAAWASDQSRAIPDRIYLETRYREAVDRFGSGAIPKPPEWGGYRVVPEEYEFWRGRPNRLHDRLLYARGPGDAWSITRLAP